MSRRHFLIGLLCLAWILPGLTGHEPWKTDEPYNFGVIYDMLRGGSWLVPTLAGEPFLHEPPLYYLTAAFTAWLTSPLLPLHDGARLATGIYMALTLLFCGLAGRELHGKGNGAISALLLLGCFGLVLRGHETITDIAPLAGFALAYYAWALSLRRERLGGALLGAALGIVFLSQGSLETLILMALAGLLPLICREWRTQRYAMALLVAAAIAAPLIAWWPLALHARSPALFASWLNGDLYAIGNRGPGDYFYYMRILPWHAWPVWALCLWQLWYTRREQYASPAVALPLAGFVVTLLVLSLGGSGRDLYALILLPAASLLAARAIPQLPRGAANAWLWFGITGASFFVVVGWFYWSGLEMGVPARLHAHLNRLQPAYTPGFKLWPFLMAALYTVAWFALVFKLKRTPQRPVIVWAAAVTVLWGLSAALFAGWFDTGKSYRQVFTSHASRHLPAQYRLHCQPQPWRYAARHGAVLRKRHHAPGGIVARTMRLCNLLLVQSTGPPTRRWRIKPVAPDLGRPTARAIRVERYRLYQRTLTLKRSARMPMVHGTSVPRQ